MSAQPLLERGSSRYDGSDNTIEEHRGTFFTRLQASVRDFLCSKLGHYFVFILVSLDVSCIFADIFISLYQCDHDNKIDPAWDITRDVLNVVSLVFSCLFMAELLASIWAFGSS